MLSVYTRHYPPCPQHDLHYRRCHCPKWLGAVRENRGFVRFSAHTRSWATAEVKAREMERKVEEPSIGIANAVTAYLNMKMAANCNRKLCARSGRFSKASFFPGAANTSCSVSTSSGCLSCGSFARPGILGPEPLDARISACGRFLRSVSPMDGCAAIPATCSRGHSPRGHALEWLVYQRCSVVLERWA